MFFKSAEEDRLLRVRRFPGFLKNMGAEKRRTGEKRGGNSRKGDDSSQRAEG